MAGNFTIDNRGEKTIQIRRTGNEKNWFTVILTVITGENCSTVFFLFVLLTQLFVL
jgi:hypothetical protein